MVEIIIKIILLIVVVIAVLTFWLLPKSRFSDKIKMTVSLFIITNALGILCSATGLVVIVLFPNLVIEAHLWELIVMPYALFMIYWLIIIRKKKSTAIIDEKQEWNMSQAAGITIGGTIVILSIVFQLSTHNLFQLNDGLWFPFYLFITLFLFSLSTLFFFKKS